jgi:hypothetical protein
MEPNFQRFSPVSSHLAGDISPQDDDRPQVAWREKQAAAQASRKLGPPANAMHGTKSRATDRIVSSKLAAKKKGDPRAALPVPDAGMCAGFRLSHHVHTASSARLPR